MIIMEPQKENMLNLTLLSWNERNNRMMKDGRFGWKRYHVKMFNTFVTITCTVTEFIERNSDALWVHEIKVWDGLVKVIFVQARRY